MRILRLTFAACVLFAAIGASVMIGCGESAQPAPPAESSPAPSEEPKRRPARATPQKTLRPLQPATAPAAPPAQPPTEPPSVQPPAPSSPARPVGACRESTVPIYVSVIAPTAPVFIRPQVLQVPLTTLSRGVTLLVSDVAQEWYLIRFDDRRWGDRSGYIHCSNVASADEPRPTPAPVTEAPPPASRDAVEAPKPANQDDLPPAKK